MEESVVGEGVGDTDGETVLGEVMGERALSASCVCAARGGTLSRPSSPRGELPLSDGYPNSPEQRR